MSRLYRRMRFSKHKMWLSQNSAQFVNSWQVPRKSASNASSAGSKELVKVLLPFTQAVAVGFWRSFAWPKQEGTQEINEKA